MYVSSTKAVLCIELYVGTWTLDCNILYRIFSRKMPSVAARFKHQFIAFSRKMPSVASRFKHQFIVSNARF